MHATRRGKGQGRTVQAVTASARKGRSKGAGTVAELVPPAATRVRRAKTAETFTIAQDETLPPVADPIVLVDSDLQLEAMQKRIRELVDQLKATPRPLRIR